MNLKSNSKKGFSIIEVVLVLAIAGLIFLMVFIALPALQRNQRDTQRRNDAGAFISQVNSYATNNNGKVPATGDVDTFAANYLKWASTELGEFNDPKTGSGYDFVVDPATNFTVGMMAYQSGKKCGDTEGTFDDATSRSAAVIVKLEGSGSFCKSNQ